MGPLYWDWVDQYQSTDRLMAMMFVFGMLLMVGYYGSEWLSQDPAKIRWVKNIQAAIIIAIIIMTLAAPSLVDAGIIVMDR